MLGKWPISNNCEVDAPLGKGNRLSCRVLTKYKVVIGIERGTGLPWRQTRIVILEAGLGCPNNLSVAMWGPLLRENRANEVAAQEKPLQEMSPKGFLEFSMIKCSPCLSHEQL